MRRSSAIVACLVTCFAGFSAPAAAEDDVLVTGSVRAGGEWDDNVFRQEGVDAERGFLSRYFAAVDAAARTGPRGVAAFRLDHGGKFFLDDAHQEADTLLTQIDLGYRHRFARPVGGFVSLDMKDRTERDLGGEHTHRDYTRAGGVAGVDLFFGDFAARLGGGGRYFSFKPAPGLSSRNLEAQARLQYRLLEHLSLVGGYTLARRGFDSARYDIPPGGDFPERVLGEERRDLSHVAFVGAAYRGPLVLDVSYSFFANASNSYGQDFRRHGVDVTATAPLLWGFYGSLHLELQRTRYQDPVFIDASFETDEDNRNAVVAALAYPFAEHWEAEVRYRLYLQEFGVGSDYRRQTFLLALGYLFDT